MGLSTVEVPGDHGPVLHLSHFNEALSLSKIRTNEHETPKPEFSARFQYFFVCGDLRNWAARLTMNSR